MKNANPFHYSGIILILPITIFFLITAHACKKDKCFDTIQPQYELGIRAEITVFDGDQNPVEGHTIQIRMQKTHCDGSKGPNLTSEGETSSNGIYTPGATWTFKMNNSEDFIEIGVSSQGTTITSYFDLRSYNDLKQYAGSTYLHKEEFILK